MEILSDKPNLLFLIWIRAVFIYKNHALGFNLLVTRLREPIYRTKIIKALTVKTTTTDGDQEWWINGKRHREDGPAIIYAIGDQRWYINGRLHRENEPAIIYANGTQSWYLNGKRHREDGPAIICTDGDKEWYINGKRHRVNGPAVITIGGNQYWYINGKEIEPPKN